MSTYGLGRAPSGRGSRRLHITRPNRETMYLCQVENISSNIRRLIGEDGQPVRKRLEEWLEHPWVERILCTNCVAILEENGGR